MRVSLQNSDISLESASLPRHRLATGVPTQLLRLQVEAYELRLSLQPNSADAQTRFAQCRYSENHLRFQQSMGEGLWHDWKELGRDTLHCLRYFGNALATSKITPPNGLDAGHLHGLRITRDTSEPCILGLHPDMVTALNQIHHRRGEAARAACEFRESSLSQASIYQIERRATVENHEASLPDRVPLLSNCDRIAVMVQCVALAKLDEPHFTKLIDEAPAGNPFGLPLHVIEGPGNYSPISASITTVQSITRGWSPWGMPQPRISPSSSSGKVRLTNSAETILRSNG